MSVDLVVVGLGYVGMPLANLACRSGLSTVGYDVSGEVVRGVLAGHSHVGDVPDSDVARMLAEGFRATTDPAVLARADTVVVCVPTGLSAGGTPDLTALRDATRTVGAHLRRGALVVVESTSHPGTTDELVAPLLERHSGMRVGEDFHLGHSPERIDPGNDRFGVHNTPKIVSGCTPLCTKFAAAFYGRFVESVVVAAGTREAELAKLLENTYRYVNIALVNEMALFCDQVGIDVWDVLRCAATKPFGFSAFAPGPGVGGHCIPVDPIYLSDKAESEGFAFTLLEAARGVNSGMPEQIVRQAVRALAERGRPVDGCRVLLLGVSYKADVADTRESPAAPIAAGLRSLGAAVTYHDPLVERFAACDVPVPREPDLDAALRTADLAILLQAHQGYDPPAMAGAGCAVLDTRGPRPPRRIDSDVGRVRRGEREDVRHEGEIDTMTASVANSRLKKRFDTWDANKNGVLESADFERESDQIAEAFGLDRSSPKVQQLRSAFSGMFGYLAEQAGGYASLSEEQFVRVTEKIMQDGEASLDHLLRPVMQSIVGLCDKNDDGRINEGEFASWLSALGVSASEGKEKFRLLDKNGDGELSVDELLGAVRDYHLGKLDVDLLG